MSTNPESAVEERDAAAAKGEEPEHGCPVSYNPRYDAASRGAAACGPGGC